MYVIFLQSTHCIKKTLTVSCTLLCESGDRVKVDKSSFSADLHAVMLRHHCSEYALEPLFLFSSSDHRLMLLTSSQNQHLQNHSSVTLFTLCIHECLMNIH